MELVWAFFRFNTPVIFPSFRKKKSVDVKGVLVSSDLDLNFWIGSYGFGV
jgi:hypothetical protein